MANSQSKLVGFLRELGESNLAERLEGVSNDTSNSVTQKATEDVSAKLYSEIVRIRKPREQTIMDFDDESRKATEALGRCDDRRSFQGWCLDIVENTIPFYQHTR